MKIGTDKILHAALSTIIVIIFCVLFPVWISALISFVIGLAKEFVWDKWFGNGCFEWMDLVADITGIAIAVLIYFIIN